MTGADAVLRAERECLGLAMRSADALETVFAEVSPEEFRLPAHQIVAEALLARHAAGQPTDEAAVVGHLAALPALPGARGSATALDAAGGHLHIHGLVEQSGTAGSAGYHARAVAEAARRRRVAETLGGAARLAADPAADPAAVERDIRAALDHLSWRPGNRWPAPAPLTAPLPPFPLDALPATVGRITAAVAAATQTPPDLAAFTALAVLSAAARGSWEIRVRAGWTEQTCLYLTALADSGSRKSAVVSAVSHPLASLARAVRADDAPRVAAADAHHRVLEARAKNARDRAAKAAAGDFHDAMAEAEDLSVQLAAAAPPARFRLLCDDVTPEALAQLMAEQGGPMAVLTAEGGLLGTLAGRYADRQPNLDLVLKAHGGEASSAHRVSRPAVEIDRPILTLAFVVQPDVLAAALRVPELTSRGLLPRMLYASPASTLGTRDPAAPPVGADVAGEWAATVAKLFASGREQLARGGPGVVEVGPAALRAFDRWRGPGGHESRLHPDLGDLADLAAWGSKLPGALARVAALFALADRPGDARPAVGEGDMTAALHLAPYLVAHAREVLTGGGHRDRLQALLDWVKRTARVSSVFYSHDPDVTDRTGPTRTDNDREWSFSLREAQRGIGDQSWVRRVDDVEQALTHLADLGWVRRLPPGPTRGGRPPSPRYQVNPHALRSWGRTGR